MVNIKIEKPELIWPGKYDETGLIKEIERINLPFQIIETINKSRAEREKRKVIGRSIYDFFEKEEGQTPDEGWKNKLIWGDNKIVMSSLLKQFSGKIDLIYIDPPFATGADFKYIADIGESNIKFTKEHTFFEEKAYRDTWGRGIDSFISMMYERLILMRDLLKKNGVICVHCDNRVKSFLRLILDEIYGRDNNIGEFIWLYSGREMNKTQWNPKHDTIWCYSKSNNWTFNWKEVSEEPSEEVMKQYKHVDEQGRRYVIRSGQSKGLSKEGPDTYRQYYSPIPPRDYKYFSYISSSSEVVGYPTQKPENLIAHFVKAFTNTNGLIADLFCGSGTTCSVAEKLERRWIGCDLSRWAIHTTRKRLLDFEDCTPFEVLNLGKYERQYWQDRSFGKDKTKVETTIFEYIAFILKLYEASPISGTQYIHGKKGKAMIHVGSVDSPVTIDEINLCIDECLALKQEELHILGWEWEMGLYELMIKEAKSKGVKLSLLNIPREVMDLQAVEKGDVKFYELAYVDANINKIDDKKIKVTLSEFAIPNSNLIPEEIIDKIKHWSDYIDYWAIDWDFQNDTFINGWVAYRTRKNRKLSLSSDIHKYKNPGKYSLFVKVVDIFGNDTSVPYEIEV